MPITTRIRPSTVLQPRYLEPPKYASHATFHAQQTQLLVAEEPQDVGVFLLICIAQGWDDRGVRATEQGAFQCLDQLGGHQYAFEPEGNLCIRRLFRGWDLCTKVRIYDEENWEQQLRTGLSEDVFFYKTGT